MKCIYDSSNYIIDPHGAIGCLAWDSFLVKQTEEFQGVILETAHPSKFIDVFNKNLNYSPEIPKRLADCLEKKGSSISISNDYDEFKEFLLS